MPHDSINELPYRDPQFWAGQELGWAVIVRVDDQAYSLMGVQDLEGYGIRPATVHCAEFCRVHIDPYAFPFQRWPGVCDIGLFLSRLPLKLPTTVATFQ